MKFKIAAVQMTSTPDVGENLLVAAEMIKKAFDQGAKMVVLPENFAFMGLQSRDILTVSEPQGDGRIQSFLSEQSLLHHIWIVAGTIPIQSDFPEKVFASCLVFNDQGKNVEHYNKIHLFDVQVEDQTQYYRESEKIKPGDRVVSVETPFANLGLSVCYDLRFPELYRNLLLKNAQIFTVPSAFTSVTGRAHWEVLLRARAIENLCYVVAPNQAGKHLNHRETYGHSMIIDPWGNILAEQSEGIGIVIAEIDLDYLNERRKYFPAIQHRRL